MRGVNSDNYFHTFFVGYLRREEIFFLFKNPTVSLLTVVKKNLQRENKPNLYLKSSSSVHNIFDVDKAQCSKKSEKKLQKILREITLHKKI